MLHYGVWSKKAENPQKYSVKEHNVVKHRAQTQGTVLCVDKSGGSSAIDLSECLRENQATAAP